MAALHAAGERLPDVHTLAWDRQLPGAVPQRQQRYILRTFFDLGSGVLIWSSNRSAVDRWDYAVNHHWLPVSKALGDTVDELVARYDDASEDLRQDPQRFADDEWQAFTRSYFAVVDELRHQLGPAYVVWEESGLPML